MTIDGTPQNSDRHSKLAEDYPSDEVTSSEGSNSLSGVTEFNNSSNSSSEEYSTEYEFSSEDDQKERVEVEISNSYTTAKIPVLTQNSSDDEQSINSNTVKKPCPDSDKSVDSIYIEDLTVPKQKEPDKPFDESEIAISTQVDHNQSIGGVLAEKKLKHKNHVCNGC